MRVIYQFLIVSLMLLLACAPKGELGSLLPNELAALDSSSKVRILDPQIESAIEGVIARSSAFAEAWREIENSGLLLLIGTPKQVRRWLNRDASNALGGHYGASMYFYDERGNVTSAVVVIDVAKIIYQGMEFGGLTLVREALDVILVHEIYGHVAPIATALHINAICADPAPGQAFSASCVGRRERKVLAELGYQRREGYALVLGEWGRDWGSR